MKGILNFLVFRFSSPGVFPASLLLTIWTNSTINRLKREALEYLPPEQRDRTNHPDFLLIKQIEARPDFTGLGLSLPPDVFKAYSQAAKRINYQPFFQR